VSVCFPEGNFCVLEQGSWFHRKWRVDRLGPATGELLGSDRGAGRFSTPMGPHPWGPTRTVPGRNACLRRAMPLQASGANQNGFMTRRVTLLRLARWGITAFCALLVVMWPLTGIIFNWGHWAGSAGLGGIMCNDWGSDGPQGWRFFGFPGPIVLWPQKLDDKLFGGTSIEIPTWPLYTPLVIATAWCWWADWRRRKYPGHCQRCKYNLTGNLTGNCPECGTPIPEELQEQLKAGWRFI
jgi:hypothetical protein